MFGIVIAFKNYQVAAGKGFLYSLFVKSPWVGFDNFEFLFKTKYVMTMLRNTLGYNIIFIILGVVLPVSLAILLSELLSRRLARV
jgi:putative aldouronate transport system permease protein